MRRSLCWRGYKTRRSSAELLPADVALQRFKSKFLCRDAKGLQLGFVCTDKIVVCLKQKKEKKFQWFFCLISPIFSESSQKEWRKPFDFPTGLSGFPMLMVSIPTTDIQIWVGAGGGGGNPDPEIRETPGLQNKKISALRASVWCKNKGGRRLLP